LWVARGEYWFECSMLRSVWWVKSVHSPTVKTQPATTNIMYIFNFLEGLWAALSVRNPHWGQTNTPDSQE
jgi:hypothetical protein